MIQATAIQYLGSHHPNSNIYMVMLQMTVRTKEDHQNYHLSVHMHATPWTIRIRSLLILVQRLGIHLLSQNCSMHSGCCYYPLPLAEMNLTKMLLRKMPWQLFSCFRGLDSVAPFICIHIVSNPLL